MLLEVSGLQAGYSGASVLTDVSFDIGAGEVVALLGRNGMGKTTTVRCVMGLLPIFAGKISIDGVMMAGQAPYRVARRGLGLVPEGRQIFPSLSVEENLIATAANRFGAQWNLARVYALFPRLKERRRNAGHALSGGEQQMLAIGRALMTNPRLLILDEATEGLAPLVRAEIWEALARLKQERLAILVIDKHLARLLTLADRHVVIEKGRTVWSGTSAALAAAANIRERYLHV